MCTEYPHHRDTQAGDEYDDEYGDLRDDDAGGGGAVGRSLQWRRDALSLTTLHMGVRAARDGKCVHECPH